MEVDDIVGDSMPSEPGLTSGPSVPVSGNGALGANDPQKVLNEPPKTVQGRVTRGCPSCESGMNVPGIRR